MSTSGAARGFSEMADDYVDITPIAEALVAHAGIGAGERVLDVGCGPATATRRIHEIVGAHGVTVGVDLADGMLRRARSALPAVPFWPMDAAALAFAGGSFDAVVASSVIQFAGPGAAAEWKRVVRPGGRVAFSFPWGPVTWFELAARYIDRTAEPYRSELGPRLPKPPFAPPDPERTCAALGFASVQHATQPLVQTFESPDEAWASQYTHGSRLLLEALDESTLADFRAEYVDAVRTPTGGAELRSEVHFMCLAKSS